MSGAGSGQPPDQGETFGPEQPSRAIGFLASPGTSPAIDPGTLLAEAWAIFRRAWPTCLLVYWGAIAAWWLINNLLVIVLASINVGIGDPSFTPFLEFVRFLGVFLIPVWLWLGQGKAFLAVARKQPVALNEVFRGAPYLLTALLACVVFLAITAIPCVIVYGSAEGLLAVVGGDSIVATARRLLPARTPETVAEIESGLIVLFGLFMGSIALTYASFFAVRVRLRPFIFLIIDRHAGVLRSIGTSLQLTRGRIAALFLVHLAQFTINFAGLLLCCAGLFVTLPLTSLISAVTYNALAYDLPPVETFDDATAEEEPA